MRVLWMLTLTFVVMIGCAPNYNPRKQSFDPSLSVVENSVVLTGRFEDHPALLRGEVVADKDIKSAQITYYVYGDLGVVSKNVSAELKDLKKGEKQEFRIPVPDDVETYSLRSITEF